MAHHRRAQNPPLSKTNLPVHRVVPAIADVDGNLAERGLKHRMAGVALHIVRRLIKVAHTWDVILQPGWQKQALSTQPAIRELERRPCSPC